MNTNQNYFKKNKLDLEYQKHIQILNGLIIFGTTGLLSFIGTFIWNKELLLQGATIATIIIVISFCGLYIIHKKLRYIEREIEKLS